MVTGINDESEVQRVSIDHPHIRPSDPQIRVTSFGLLEKVDAFYDFSWWSGVITQKLADSRYIVYFKHKNKVKEFRHVELRQHVELKDDNWFPTCQVPFSDVELRETNFVNLTDLIVNTASDIDLQTSGAKMKSINISGIGALKPHKKLKAGIDAHGSTNGDPSKEVSTPIGETIVATKNHFLVKKTPAKQAKSVELKRPVNTSAKKKGTSSAGYKGLKGLVKAAGDLALTTIPTAVKRRRVNPELSAPVVLGLRCKAMTVPKNKKSKQLLAESTENVGEHEPPQSAVPLVSKTTDNQVNQDTETDGDTAAGRKWGRTFTRNAKRTTLLALNDEQEDANVSKSSDKTGLELALQQDGSSKLVKGKRGRRRTISLNRESSPQDLPTEEFNIIEKSLGTEPEVQLIKSWFRPSRESAGEKRHIKSPLSATKNKDQNPSFDKKNSFWESVKTIEAFRIFPQNPHFGPLNSLNESARERSAIHKMVDFSTVFEDACRLRRNDPRTKVEDQLEILSELETHGFDVDSLRSRLKEILSLKDEVETHTTGVKKPKDNIGSERAKIQERNRHITVLDRQSEELCEKRALIDRQCDELRVKREQLMRDNENSELKIVALEDIVDVHEKARGECERKFDDLVTAPF